MVDGSWAGREITRVVMLHPQHDLEADHTISKGSSPPTSGYREGWSWDTAGSTKGRQGDLLGESQNSNSKNPDLLLLRSSREREASVRRTQS